jgi:molybdate transport system substrate-binding protein
MTFRVCTIYLLVCLATSCENQKKSGDEVTVFCAASLTPVLQQIKTDWEKEHPEKIIINSASSGTLARQIEYGARADIFLSANHDWMAYVLNATDNSNTSKTIAKNSLALIVNQDTNIDSADFQSSIEILLDVSEKITLGDPGHVPLGKYTKQALDFYGIYESIQTRVIRAKDARSTLRLVELGEAVFGLVYLTDAIASDQVKIIAIAPDACHEQIAYEAVLINESSPAAQQFLLYLSSEQAKGTWISNGFYQ